MVTLNLTEEQAKKLYAYVDDDVRKLLEDACGKKVLTDVRDRVKTYEDACAELGRYPYNEDALMKLGLTRNDIAYQKMVVIVEALNEGWKPDVCDSNVRRWYPWFKPNGSPSSFAFDDSGCDCGDAGAGSGSRLALKSEELAGYCGIQFLELWKEIIL